ncbi:glycoside hydrolase family 25 protein [Aliiroseovarius marinus]|uniref:glycoside hydrolase family 25 protein n=1 Tax=Aliiroseovarius marinus TaxID=2500159 RepID=UPI003D7D382C
MRLFLTILISLLLSVTIAQAGKPLKLNPKYEDADPYPWDEIYPYQYPVHGLDVSRWQGDINWKQARRSGVSFVFIKATEGVEEKDPMFQSHWRGAGRAGVPRAAYHYFYFCAPATKQARWFIRNVPKLRNGLPHVLDMEWNPRSPTCRHRPTPRKVRAEAKRFLDILEAHYGRRPIVYTTVDFWQDTGIGKLKDTYFWLRSVAAHPKDRYPGANWLFWQYTGTGLVPGVKGKVDINVFRSTPENWLKFSRQ